jgi:uncharacterized protein (DUF58 family)
VNQETAELIRRVRRLDLRARRVARTGLAGAWRSVHRGRGMAFEEVRPYIPGDEVRFIDWNVTARAGDPHVKVFQEERELRLLVLLDDSASQAFGGNADAKIRTGAHAAVALAAAATRGGDRAGLLTFDHKVQTRIPLRSGPSHLLRLARAALGCRGQGKGTDLIPPIEEATRVMSGGGIVAICSDFQCDGWMEALRRLGRRCEVLLLPIVDPAELTPPPVGLVRVGDPETGASQLVDMSSTGVFQAWESAALARQRELHATARSIGGDLLPLRTDQDAIEAIDRHYQRRARGGTA